MAGSASYTAILDACVLYPATLRNVLLSLAQAGLYHARWTTTIEAEWAGNLLLDRPDIHPDQLRRIQEMMNEAVPDCQVTHFEPLVAGLTLPDPKDRHVLAAAIAGHADAIVTLNLRDFPAETLTAYNIEAQHPDEFVMNQLELREYEALAAIKRMRGRMSNPALTPEAFVKMLEQRGLVQCAQHLRQRVDLI